MLGALPTWWSSSANGDIKPPYSSKEDLEAKLLAVGFAKPEAVVVDAEAPHQLTTTFLVKPIREAPVNKSDPSL